MKVSFLSQSPAVDFSKKKRSKIKEELYQFDQVIADKYSVIFSQLVAVAQDLPHNHFFQSNHGRLLLPSVYLILSYVFSDLEIINKARSKTVLLNNVVQSPLVTPQYKSEMRDLFDNPLLQKQLFSKILGFLEGSFNMATSEKFFSIYQIKNIKYFFTRRILGFKKDTKTKLQKFDQKKQNIIFLNPHNLKQHLIKTVSYHNIIDASSLVMSLCHFPQKPNIEIRSKIEKNLIDFFSKTLIPLEQRYLCAKLVSIFLPISIVEKFEQNFISLKKKIELVQPLSVFTSLGQHSEYGMLLLLIAAEKNIPIYVFQHGSAYSEAKYNIVNKAIELASLPCTYYSWGKLLKKEKFEFRKLANIRPLGSPYLNSLKKIGYGSKKITKIVVALENIYNYQSSGDLYFSPTSYCLDKIRIYIAVFTKLLKRYPHLQIIFKTRNDRYDFLKEAVFKYTTNMSLDKNLSPIYEYFAQDTIILCSNPGGAFHEALMSNQKWLLFWRKDVSEFKDSINKIFSSFSKTNLVAKDAVSLYRSLDNLISRQNCYTMSKVQRLLKKYMEAACMKNLNWLEQVHYD